MTTLELARSQQHQPAWDSAIVTLTLAGSCAALGLVAMPLFFAGVGGSANPATPWEVLWLVAAVAISIALLVLLPRLTRPLSVALWRQVGAAGSPLAPSVTPSQTLLLARLLLLGLGLVVTQAILRRPLALLIGGDRSAAPVEAAIAAFALAVILAMLVWMYRTGRPVVQTITLRAIDAAIPTLGAVAEAEPTRTVAPAGGPPRASASTGETTLRAQPHDATIRSPHFGEQL
jgi:hypothetical protein